MSLSATAVTVLVPPLALLGSAQAARGTEIPTVEGLSGLIGFLGLLLLLLIIGILMELASLPYAILVETLTFRKLPGPLGLQAFGPTATVNVLLFS